MQGLRLPHLLLAVVLLSAPLGAAVLACSCVGGAPPVRFNRAQAVFVGQMLSGTERVAIQKGEDAFDFVEAGSVRFSVEEAFKGPLGSEVTIQIASERNNSCGPYGLQRGVRYLMYAYASEAEPTKLYSGACSHSTEVDGQWAQEDLEFLRNLPPPGTGGTLQGRVTKNLRWEGLDSFPDFKVQLRGPTGQVINVVTDREGLFQLTGLPPGKYRVEPQFPSGYGPEYDKLIQVTLADRGTAKVSIEAFTDGRIYGRVLDRAGRSYNRAFLMMEPEGVSTGWSTTLYGHSSGGRAGAFEFLGVPPGRYRMYLEVYREDFAKPSFTEQRYYYPGTFERSAAAVITLGRAEKVRGLEFRLPPGFLVHSVEGTVVSPDGRAVANVLVGFHCRRSSRPERGVLETNVVQDVQTDANGRFRLEAIGDTTYWLVARRYDTTLGSYEHSGGVSLDVTRDVLDRQLVLAKVGEVPGCDESSGPPAKLPPLPPKPEEVAALIEEARERIAEDKLIDPWNGSARDTLVRLRLLEPPLPQVAELSRVVADSLLQKGRAALRATAYARSQQLLDAARELGPVSDPAALEKAEADLRRARQLTGR